jgi:hypothetical protein
MEFGTLKAAPSGRHIRKMLLLTELPIFRGRFNKDISPTGFPSVLSPYINVVVTVQSYADVGNYWRWFRSPKNGTANNQAFQGNSSFSRAENTLASRLQRDQSLC